jgi:predicted DNA-binding transcriptional regulator AlpA
VRSRRQRPPVVTGGVDAVAVTLPITADPTTPPAPDQDSHAAGPVPVRDKLRWTWADVEALTGTSKRWMQREISAKRMPAPDLRCGRCAGWRPATIRAWMDDMADHQRTRSGR